MTTAGWFVVVELDLRFSPNSKEPHSKLWGIRGKEATPQDYG
jgi:hypothetical protein